MAAPWTNAGKIVVDATGKPILCDACPCNLCPDAATLTVVLSGTINCNCVIDETATGSAQFTALSIDGSYVLPVVTPSAGWSVAGVGSYTADIYSDNCTTFTVVQTRTGDFGIYVTCAGGILTVEVIIAGMPATYSPVIFRSTGLLGDALLNAIVCGDPGTEITEPLAAVVNCTVSL